MCVSIASRPFLIKIVLGNPLCISNIYWYAASYFDEFYSFNKRMSY